MSHSSASLAIVFKTGSGDEDDNLSEGYVFDDYLDDQDNHDNGGDSLKGSRKEKRGRNPNPAVQENINNSRKVHIYNYVCKIYMYIGTCACIYIAT